MVRLALLLRVQAGLDPGPSVWSADGRWWLVADLWRGLLVLRSDDAATWQEALDRAMTTLSVKDAAAMVAEAYGLARRDVYQMALSLGGGALLSNPDPVQMSPFVGCARKRG